MNKRVFDGDFINGKFRVVTTDDDGNQIQVSVGVFEQVFEDMMWQSGGQAKRQKELFGVKSTDTEVYVNEETGKVYYIIYTGKTFNRGEKKL